MYLLSYDPQQKLVDVGFGGYLAHGEGDVFLDELCDFLNQAELDAFELLLDYSKVSRMDDGVLDSILQARDVAKLSGACRITIVTPASESVETVFRALAEDEDSAEFTLRRAA